MACDIVDLDKYEFLNDIVSMSRCDSSANIDYFEDFQTIDAEIIDYGICEDDVEEREKKSITSEIPLPPTENTFSNPLVNTSSIPNNHNTKRLCVKVVDCEKYPWFYTKHKSQILKRKYSNAVMNARTIVKCFKDSYSIDKEDIVINVDELSDSESNKKKHDKHKGKEISDGLSTVNKKQRCSTVIDIKKNKGLIGMKVQHEVMNKYNESCNMKRKHKKKAKQHRSSSSCKKTKAIELHELIFDRSQGNKTRERSEKCSNNDDNLVKESRKSQANKCNDLKCTLKITSPKIYMKIKKIKPKQNENIIETEAVPISTATEYRDNRACPITTESKNGQSEFCSDRPQTQYKPMPKSKRVALEKQMNRDINEYMKTEKQTCLKTVPSHTSQVKNNIPDTTLADQLTQNNSELVKKSFSHTNKFTGKVLKIVQNSSQYDTVTKKVNELRKMINMSELCLEIEKGIHKNKHPGIKIKTPESENANSLNTSEMMMTSVTKPNDAANVVQNKITQPKQHGNSSISRNNVQIATFVHYYKKERDNSALNAKKSETNITRPNKKLVENEIQYFESDVNITSANAPNQNQPQKTATLIELTDNNNSQQSKTNRCVKNSNGVEDLIKANYLNNTKIQSTTALAQLPSGPQEYIVTDFIDPPIARSAFCNEKIQPINKKNNLKEGQMTRPVSQLVLRSPSTVSKPQQVQQLITIQNNGSNAPSDRSIEKECSTGTVTAINYMPINSALPVLLRTPKAPKRNQHKIIKPYSGLVPRARFQQPSSSTPVLPPFHIPPPPPPPPLHAKRSQMHMKQVRPGHFYQYQQPNLHHMNPNTDRMPWNMNNQVGIYYTQNNFPQQTTYSAEEYQGIPHNGHVPPGLCNMQPSNDYVPNNFNQPAYPPLRPPPPPPFTTNFDNSSIIGKNTTGLIKKINIANSESTNICQQSHSKDGIVRTENTIVNTSEHRINKIPNVMVDETAPVATKLDMMKELQKATMTEITHLVNTEVTPLLPYTARPKPNLNRTLQETVRSELQTPLSGTLKPDLERAGTDQIRSHIQKPSETIKSQLKRPFHEIIKTELKRPRLETPNPKQNNSLSEIVTPKINMKNSEEVKGEIVCQLLEADQTNRSKTNKPGPLSMKYKMSDLPPPRRPDQVLPNKGYSPPILPIPTYQNILSEVQTGAKDLGVFRKPHEKRKGRKILVKNMPKTLFSKTITQLDSLKDDNTKKISLEEYKKRTLK